MLAEWDSTAPSPILKARVERAAQVATPSKRPGRKLSFGRMPDAIASLTELRVKLGDRDALRDYAGWIRTVDPGHFDLRPDPDVRAPVGPSRPPGHPAPPGPAALFENQIALEPFSRPQQLATDRRFLLDLLSSPLLGLRSFRTLDPSPRRQGAVGHRRD